MEQYRNIPLAPKKRMAVREKFTTLLMFAEKRGLKLAEWISDRRLESNWKELVECHPSHNKELDWLKYFLLVVKDGSQPLSERKNALVHLKSYYQETCYWTAKKFWENLYKKNFSETGKQIWEWQEIFDKTADIFESLENLENNLRNFQPHLGAKKYVQTVIYYNLSNWRDKKIGRNAESIGSSSLYTRFTGDSQEENDCFSRQGKVEKALAIREKFQQEISVAKKQQERVLVLFELELENVQKNKNKFVGKTHLILWNLLLLTYGLKLSQTEVVKILKINKFSINQATISRHLTALIYKLQLQLIKEFKREIQEVLGDLGNDEEEPIENRIKNWTKNNKKEINDILKDLLEERVFTLAVMPKKQQLKQTGLTRPIEVLVRQELDAWCDRSLGISINSEILPEKSNKKIEQLVRDFVARLEM